MKTLILCLVLLLSARLPAGEPRFQILACTLDTWATDRVNTYRSLVKIDAETGRTWIWRSILKDGVLLENWVEMRHAPELQSPGPLELTNRVHKLF